MTTPNNRRLLLKVLVAIAILGLLFLHFVLPGLVERSMNTVSDQPSIKIRPEVQALHDTLFVADLHADTMLWKRNFLKRNTTGHVDLPRLQEGNVALQVFSATTKSPSGLNYDSNTAESDDITKLAVLSFWPTSTWGSLFERASYQLKKLERYAERSSNEFTVIKSAEDFERFLAARAINKKLTAGLFLIEGAHPLEGELDNLDRLYEQGMRVAGLTHFFDNELGGSMHGISQEGLSDFGQAVVTRANKLGVIIDLAHASPKMANDVLNLTNRPVILSHGSLKGNCDTNRNLSDLMMRRVAANGGLLGIGFWEGAVCDGSPLGIVKAVRHAITVMGIERVALGSDFDGTVATPFDVSRMVILTQTMLDNGFTEDEIRAVMGENVKRFMLANLPTSEFETQ